MSNAHLQTIYSTAFRKLPPLSFEIQRFDLSDGDFLECFWSKIQNETPNTPIVVLFHGLAGDYKSPYIQGNIRELNAAGFNTVVMHFRGCGPQDNLLARSYHSGESGDAKEFLVSLKKRFPDSKLFALGFSLGANMLLKLLGESPETSLLNAAIAISPPMQLDVCASSIDSGLSRYYQYRLVKDLNAALLRKFDKHDLEKLIGLKREDVSKLRSFWDFDEAYTAPIHGFDSAKDYYKKCSSREFLKSIQTPTLIIHAEDDPFMSSEVIPSKEELSSAIKLELSKHGGHVGFIGGSVFKPSYWLESRVVEFFKERK